MNINNVKYNEIPIMVLDEISYMFGSYEECNSEELKPILERHGYKNVEFLLINPEDDIELTLDVYKELFVIGGFEPDYDRYYDDYLFDKKLKLKGR